MYNYSNTPIMLFIILVHYFKKIYPAYDSSLKAPTPIPYPKPSEWVSHESAQIVLGKFYLLYLCL